MKRILVIIAGLAMVSGLVSGSLWLSRFWPQGRQTQPITIAVVSPQRGPNRLSGDAIRNGLQLYLQTHDVQKMLRGQKIELRFFNDQNSVQQAAKVADSAANANALLVLGHYFSDSSLAAGDIYQQRGIPAITASATADAITQNTEWYFRTIPNNLFQGRFIASYVRHVLKQTTTAILFDTDLYGTSLAQSYTDMARKLKMAVKGTWALNRDAGNVEQQIAAIIAALRKLDHPGAIFLALHGTEAVRVLQALKLPGTQYTLIGADALATSQFLDELQQLPQERSQPGYYSDGVYTVTPFLADLAMDAGIEFSRRFQQQYRTVPGWEAACYYDALAIAVAAIGRAELDDHDLAADRRKVRDALAELSNPDLAIAGVTGTLYFDSDRNINRPLAVGMYEQQRLLPAYTQYQVMTPSKPKSSGTRPSEDTQNLLELQGLSLVPTHIVKTGMSINTISYLNLPARQYTLDGYLWFRFQGELPVDELVFQSAISPIVLNAPIRDDTDGNLSVRVYHLNSVFIPQVLTAFYPFERLILPVQFRHATLPVTAIRYVPDSANLPVTSKNEVSPINPLAGWTLENQLQVASTIQDNDVLYSRFNVILQMQRASIGWSVKNLFFLGALMLLVYWVYYIPPERLSPRLILVVCGVLATALYQFVLRRHFQPDGIMMIEYGIFMGYGLLALALIVSVGGYICYIRNVPTVGAALSFIGRIAHPLLIGLAGAALIILIMMLPRVLAGIVVRML